FDPEAAARAVTEALRLLGTPERAVQEKRYLKSDLDFFGVAVPAMRRTVKAAVRGYPGLDGPGMMAWAVALWREPGHERGGGGWRRWRSSRWRRRGWPRAT